MVALTRRLLELEVSTLSDADKTLPVLDPAIHALVPDVRFAGPARTVVARDDHLPVFAALDAAGAGDVLVVTTGGSGVAVLGELFATEARRRGLTGVVVDGYCRDLAGLRRVGLPVFARGTVPRSGSTVSRAALDVPVCCGGVDVSPGDVVFGDDDGVLVAAPDRVEAALETAESIGRAERAMLAAMTAGRPLHDLTTYHAHVAALDRGEDSALAFRVGA